MALQGSHNTLSIPDLLSFILQHKLSGALVVVSRLKERAFVFRDGELAYTLATDPHLLLGELLIEELDVDRPTLKSVLANLAM